MTDIDHNSPEEVAKRANQEDPIVMYLIVRESLNMSIGKTAAQCAHASQMLQLKYDELHGNYCYEWALVSDDELRHQIFSDWLQTSFRKVVLRADEKEFAKIQEELKDQIVVVIDAGLTELEPQTKTVIGVFPMKKSERPKLIKRLQVLK